MIDICRDMIGNHHLYKRDFPWRHTEDPYKIMIAEFMLRRTKANQVAPVYLSLIAQYPDIESLSLASKDEISNITLHLGLHWRASDFVEACKFIEKNYNGTFPQDRNKLLEITGIGDYTAGAILAVCFKKPEYVIDSNIARFLDRYYNLQLTGEIRRKKLIIEKAKELFNCKHPDKLLFSILDFTALICSPRTPDCAQCPFKSSCLYENKSK